jgi:hypothetical protein
MIKMRLRKEFQKLGFIMKRLEKAKKDDINSNF